jgi:hypothetical protein
MENRFENSPPEEQNWGAYATPPTYRSRQTGLCADVCRMLPDLLENDGSVRPEMATAIYAHLAVCPDCAREFDQMQRVIARVEALPPAEMPLDYSGLIMQRIQAQTQETQQKRAVVRQVRTVTAPADQTATASKPVATVTVTPSVASQTRSHQTAATVTQTGAQLWQRLTLGAMLSGILAFFLNSAWGRQMLGVNVATAGAWLEQVGEAISRVPILGGIAGLIFSALTQASGVLSETYHALGAVAARGLALDIAMGGLAYWFVLTRRQREQRLGV